MTIKIRLYIEAVNSINQEINLSKYHINYLINVMRLKNGNLIKVFNESGEWLAEIEVRDKKDVLIITHEQLRYSENEAEVHLAFCPLKSIASSFIVQKATELGVTHIWPIISKRTVVNKINLEKLEMIGIEAAEQCERINVPVINQIQKLEDFISTKPFTGDLIICMERSDHDALGILQTVSHLNNNCVLVGPEGGFDISEVKLFESAKLISLGKRILRAETAIICILSLLNAVTIR